MKTSTILHILTSVILVLCLPGYASHDDVKPDELLSLSLNELLAIPVDRPYRGAGIFQSDKNQVSANSINIGLLVPLTYWPKYSAQLIAAADLATDHINRHGGIAGRPLAVIRADTDNTINQSNRFAKQLVQSYNTQLLVGPVASDEAEEVLSEVNVKHQVPMMSYTASAISLTRLAGGRLFWRLLASNAQQITELIRQIKGSNRYQRIAIIGTDDIYSRELSEGIKKHLPDTTFQDWIFSSKIDPRIFNFEDEVKKLMAFNPQSIVLLTKARLNNVFLERLLHQWKGDFPLVFSGDNLQVYDLPQTLINSSRLCLVSIRSKKAADTQFIQEIEAITKMPVKTLDSAYVYDAVMLFSMAKILEINLNLSFPDALKRLTGDGYPISPLQYAQLTSLAKQYKSFSYRGASGRVKFDAHGDNLAATLGAHTEGKACH